MMKLIRARDNQFGTRLKLSDSDPAESAVKYAGLSQRAIALVIDNFVIYGVLLVLGVFLSFVGAETIGRRVLGAALLLVGATIITGYFVGMDSSKKQATLGKIVLGIQISDLQGQRLTPTRALVRSVVKLLLFFASVYVVFYALLGSVFIAFDSGWDVARHATSPYVSIGLLLLVPFIMAAFTKKRQALHDMIAGSIVVVK